MAVYGEIEHEVSLATLAQYALRYENFSDFGGTLNGKVALRHDLNDTVTLRGSVNTGFHAPTPGQSNLQKVTTTFDNDTGLQVESGTVRPDHPGRHCRWRGGPARGDLDRLQRWVVEWRRARPVHPGWLPDPH